VEGLITYTLVVMCWRCRSREENNQGLEPHKRHFEARLRSGGWSLNQEKGWTCPTCVADKKADQKQQRAAAKKNPKPQKETSS
jgi:hypothetical protein